MELPCIEVLQVAKQAHPSDLIGGSRDVAKQHIPLHYKYKGSSLHDFLSPCTRNGCSRRMAASSDDCIAVTQELLARMAWQAHGDTWCIRSARAPGSPGGSPMPET